MNRVSVIIVNWNGKHLLAECLDSLAAQTRPADEVLVVDNGSTDGSQAFLRASYPWVTLIELDKNKGFSIANNVGIRQATGDYIALLNNDLLVHPHWIAHMTAALDADERLGSCASKMLFYDRRDTLDGAGVAVGPNGVGGNRGVNEHDGGPFDAPATVFGPCAGAAMYRASMLQDIGLFDEDLFLYYEDVDLAFRAQLAGYDCLYVPNAVVYHHHSASSDGSGKKYWYLGRNNLLVVVKDMPGPLVRRYLPRIVAAQLWFALAMGMRGGGSTYVRSRLDGLRLLLRMLRKRRTIQSAARRSAEQIAARLDDPRL